MASTEKRGFSSSDPFHHLDFVFSSVSTDVLTPTEERQLTDELWQRRRRVYLTLLWAENPSLFGSVPPPVKVHREVLTPELVRRISTAEKRARELERSLRSSAEGVAPALLETLRDDLRAIDEVRDQLFHRNLRLIAWVARGYLGKGLELPDLFQEGSMALLKSIDRFDPARGVRLSTYATHSIRLGLLRALTDRGRPIRIPNYRFREVVDTSKARSALMERLGREPRMDELEEETGLGREILDDLLPALRSQLPLDAPIGGTTLSLGDTITDRSSVTQFEKLAAIEARTRAGDALSRLPERERAILTMRYGLVDGEELTFDEIGKEIGLSRERTRQLERSAREKLRNVLREAV